MGSSITRICAAIVLSIATATFSSPVRAQEPDAKCRAEQLRAKLESNVIPDMVGCPVKPTLMVLRRFDHVPEIAEVTGPAPAGIIVSQDPPAETRRRSDIRLSLNYSDGRAVAIPATPQPTSDLGVTVTMDPPSPYKPGDVVKFWVVVHNKGTAPIPFARVSMELSNLEIVSVNPTFADACHEVPCDLREIPPEANVSLFVRARIGNDASFRSVITATPRLPDAVTDDNRVVAEGTVDVPVVVDNDGATESANDPGVIAGGPDAPAETGGETNDAAPGEDTTKPVDDPSTAVAAGPATPPSGPGEDVPKPRPIPWTLIIVAVIAVIGAGVATHAIRKARWTRMIKVSAHVDPRLKTTAGPIERVVPIEVRVRVLPGETRSSPIPLREA